MRDFSPLKGVCVIDLSRLLPGPYCTKILADMGAQVIKVEDVTHGDPINQFSPRFHHAESVMGVFLNKNKKRLKIDLKSKEGRAMIQRLVKKSDVVVNSYRPGVMKKMGLDAATLHRINRRLICVSLVGYAQGDRRAHQAGHDINFMAVSSLLHHFIAKDQKGTAHVPDFQMADIVGGGVFGAMMILAALLHKKRDRISLNVSMVSSLVYLNQHRFFTGECFDLGELSGELARYNLYKTKDGQWMALGALEDKFWHLFCDVIRRPDLKVIGFDRKKNHMAIRELKKIFATRTSRYWQQQGLKFDICLTKVSNGDDLIAEGYLRPVSLRHGGRHFRVYENNLKGFLR